MIDVSAVIEAGKQKHSTAEDGEAWAKALANSRRIQVDVMTCDEGVMSCQFEHTDKGKIFWWGGLNHLETLLNKYAFTGVDVMPGMSNGALAHITLTAPDNVKKYEEAPEGILVVSA